MFLNSGRTRSYKYTTLKTKYCHGLSLLLFYFCLILSKYFIMTNDIYLIGEVGYEITLNSVIEKVNNSDKSKPLNVNIHSGGGSVYDGLAIYNYLKGLDQEVNTSSSGLVASIASIFFLAGKNRVINNSDSFLIHLPWSGAQGNAIDFEKTAKELRDIENKLSDIYALETGLTKDEALELMNKDEMLDVNFLKDKGFVNSINEFKAVAKLNLTKNEEMSEKLTEEEKQGLFAKFADRLENFFKTEEAPKNKMVQSAADGELNFPDVEEDADPMVGDKATIEGVAADGDIVMPSGQTFKFTNGELMEIIEAAAEEEAPEENAELEAANAKVAELQAELDAKNSLVEEKETELAGATAKLEDFETIKNEFTELKNAMTSDYTPETKNIVKEVVIDGVKTTRTPIKK